MMLLNTTNNIAQKSQKGKVQSCAERWQQAQRDGRCQAILLTLFESGATNSFNSMSYRQISRRTSIHHNTIRRLIAGDKKCRSKLMGLVRYPEKGKRSGCYLTPEGRIVAEKWAKGETFSFEQLKLLAESQQNRRNLPSLSQNPLSRCQNNSELSSNQNQPMAHLWHTYGTPSFSYSYMQMNECSMNVEAAKLEGYGIKRVVAMDLANRYSPQVIDAAIAIREKRNGAIYNPAGFIVWLLRSGYAERYLRAYQDEGRKERDGKEEFEPIYYRKWRDVKREIYSEEVETTSIRELSEEESEVPLGTEQNLRNVLDSPERGENERLTKVETARSREGDCEGEEIQDRCLKCGQKEEELNKQGIFLGIDGICTACKGMEPHSRQCADCGLERDQPFNEIRYRGDFDLVLCRKCWLKRVRGKLDLTDTSQALPFPIQEPHLYHDSAFSPTKCSQGNQVTNDIFDLCRSCGKFRFNCQCQDSISSLLGNFAFEIFPNQMSQSSNLQNCYNRPKTLSLPFSFLHCDQPLRKHTLPNGAVRADEEREFEKQIEGDDH